MNQKTNMRATLPILIALSSCHLLNDLMQSVISASYPVIKSDMGLSFTQIGTLSLVYQLAASVFQPAVGFLFDKHPMARSINIASVLTFIGLTLAAIVPSYHAMLCAVFCVGLGSSIVHPEAARITSLASGGRRGMAQSLFQVGGNVGNAAGPLLVALIVAPFGRANIAWFCLFAVLAIIVSQPACKWYSNFLCNMKRENNSMTPHRERPLSGNMTMWALFVLTILIFSKYIYLASLSNYYTFYAIEHFGVSVSTSQVMLFVFLFATAVGTLAGGPIGDKIGRKYVIWISILGTAPFSLLMPHMGLSGTICMSFGAGFMISSAFPAILLYAQELLPNKLGLISGLFYGFAFGVAGIASAILGSYVDQYGLDAVYNICAYMPLAGLVAAFLPNLKKIQVA